MANAGNVAVAQLYRVSLVCMLFFILISAAFATETVANSLPFSVTSNASTSAVATSTQKNATPTLSISTGAPPAQTTFVSNPLWGELTAAQQQALAPLANDWDKIESFRKKKWLEIGNKFSSMKPDEQQRVQDKMREWTKLTPEQRRIARENYTRTKKLGSDQKSAEWQQYQQLPEEQKQKLAIDAEKKKRVANLPSPHNKNKVVPSIKSTPKPVLEQSVTPQVAKRSTIQPSAPPVNK